LNPPTPSARTHAIYALTRTQDEELIQETFKFMMKEVKSQDLMYFFVGFNINRKTRRQLFTFFKENYDEARIPYL
jgi:aminopeptidase 2